MIKAKVRVKDYQLFAKVKVSSDFVINTNQCDLLFKKYKYGFLKLDNVRKNKFEFSGPVGISLYERLKKPIDKYEFFFIIEQIIDVAEKLEKIGLSRNNLILDIKYVFINESTKEVSFIYLPIATPHSGIGILSFIEQIVYSAKPIEHNSKYLSDFSYFLKSFDDFDVHKIELYIENIDSEIIRTIKKTQQDKTIKNNRIISKSIKNNQCEQLPDIITDDEKTEIMDNDEATELFANNNSVDFSNRQLNGYEHIGFREEYDSIDENTCSLDDEATELFDDEKTEMYDSLDELQRHPQLIRMSTEEVINIDKPVFRIGKEENCVDYIVTNNVAVSRSHADIISRGNKYYVFDLRSKNKSYINNRVLPTEYEVEIFNGDILKLANEEFIFKV